MSATDPWEKLRPHLSPYSHQPWKALAIGSRLGAALLLKPWWAVLHLFKLQPFPRSWTLSEVLTVRWLRFMTPLFPLCDLALHRSHLHLPNEPEQRQLKETRVVWIPPAPAEWVKGIAAQGNGVEVCRVPGYVWGKGRNDVGGSVRVGKGEKVVLFLHGGGLVSGSAHESDLSANHPRELLARLPPHTLQHILSPDYRKLSSSPFPGAFLDIISTYAFLLSLGILPSDIMIVGESAGGHLALALCRYLRDEMKMVGRMPGGFMLFSPWCDMSWDLGPKRLLQVNPGAETDFLDSNSLQPYLSSRLLLSLPISLLDSPYLSPSASSVPPSERARLFTNFPPCFVSAGGAEFLLGSIVELVRRMEEGGVKVVFYLEPDAVHCFQISYWFQSEKRERIWKAATEWLEARLLA